MRTALVLIALFACSGEKTQDKEVGASLSDKKDVEIANVPAEVMAAAREARPDLDYIEAEYETKSGTEYYEVAGVGAQGVEIELDIARENNSWRVVEVQRDITLADMPQPARDALLARAPAIKPARIIESDQRDGVTIYEVYTQDAAGKEAKVEVKFDGEAAEVLTEEWVH